MTFDISAPKNKIASLPRLIVLSFQPNAKKLLQGLTSNDLHSCQNAFINIHGKIIVTFFQKLLNQNEVLAIIDSSFFERLKSHVHKYLLLNDTMIEEKNLHVSWFLDEGEFPPAEHVLPQKKGALLLTLVPLETTVSEEEFRLFRLKNNIPLQGLDYDEEMLLNVSENDFVSYDKGCYLGQEIISRVHFKSKPPKHLIVKSLEDCTPEESEKLTSKIFDPTTQTTLGFLLGVRP